MLQKVLWTQEPPPKSFNTGPYWARDVDSPVRIAMDADAVGEATAAVAKSVSIVATTLTYVVAGRFGVMR